LRDFAISRMRDLNPDYGNREIGSDAVLLAGRRPADQPPRRRRSGRSARILTITLCCGITWQQTDRFARLGRFVASAANKWSAAVPAADPPASGRQAAACAISTEISGSLSR
jgi:hypothetical protein